LRASLVSQELEAGSGVGEVRSGRPKARGREAAQGRHGGASAKGPSAATRPTTTTVTELVAACGRTSCLPVELFRRSVSSAGHGDFKGRTSFCPVGQIARRSGGLRDEPTGLRWRLP
jgi:hypothetical protein